MATWKTSKAGKFTYISPDNATITGYMPDELIGATAADLMDGSEADRVSVVIGPKIANRRPFRVTVREVSKNGKPCWVEVSGSPIYKKAKYCGYAGTLKPAFTSLTLIELEILTLLRSIPQHCVLGLLRRLRRLYR